MNDQIDAAVKAKFDETVRKSAPDRETVRKLVNKGRWELAEKDPKRTADYFRRRAEVLDPVGGRLLSVNTTSAHRAESVHDEPDFQPVSFLPEGARVMKAVAYVNVTDQRGGEVGTGFMISPKLFITNAHVIADPEAALSAFIRFNFQETEDRQIERTDEYSLNPEAFFISSPVDQLDYALVAVGQAKSPNAPSVSDFGCCPISDRANKHVIGMAVNIIQHPDGRMKELVLRNNHLSYRTDTALLYETDTQPGSSGSPVFNDDWDVVALHHFGAPAEDAKDENGQPIPGSVNEGIRISAIYKDLEVRLPTLPPAWQVLLQEALDLDKRNTPAGRALTPAHQKPKPPVTTPQVAESATENTPNAQQQAPQANQATGGIMSNQGNEFRFVVPLEISIRIGTISALESAQPAATTRTTTTGTATLEVIPAAKATLDRNEALRVDQNYAARAGYDPKFLGNAVIPLPEVKDPQQIAPLQPREANAAHGELKYEHFSLKLSTTRRMALFTATNIDKDSYKEVTRATGQVATEGEKWFIDPRIDASYYLDQSFYSAWSTFFDRGHLTRRSDPSWGTQTEAERANADTFHFTNCSPQHFRFNESSKFWQGLELYVLEQGILDGHAKRLTVFQGPIFDDLRDKWADEEVQIPSAFFKIAVWQGTGGLRAVGLVADQFELLSEPRRSLGKPKDQTSIDVAQFRVAISEIETRTGLDFGDLVRNADTIGLAATPDVGEAARRVPITSMEGIFLG